MAVYRYAGLKGSLLVATAISATLGGCASVDYTKVADAKKAKQVVIMPTQTAQAAYAAAGITPVTTLDKTVGPQGPTVAAAEALKTANASGQMAMAQTSTGEPLLMQPVASDAPINPLAAAVTTPGNELAYAPPTLVAVPQPRPDIIAAANSIPTAGGPDKVETQTASLSSAQKEVAGIEQRLATVEPQAADVNPVLMTDVAIPTPRPDPQSMGLEAYASTPAMLSLDAYDTSAPKAEPVIAAESGIAPSGKLQALIKKYAALYEVPEALVHRVVRRESRYNPAAYSRGNYGLMQIRYNTARSLGYSGTPSGLFDAETNLKYAVKYLRGAFMVAENNHDNAVRLYARGYYFDAKRKGMLAQLQ